jgi:hypothetical protein
MAEISKINVGSVEYDIKDETARADIEDLRYVVENLDVSDQIATAVNELRQEILGGEW